MSTNQRGGDVGRLLASTVALALLLTGCASAGSPSKGPTGAEVLTVGVLANVDVAPLYLGKEKGFFSEEGIDLNFHMAAGGAALVPSVIQGEVQVGFSNIVSLVVARDKGLPLSIVAGGAESTNTEPDVSAVVVKKDSSFASAKDLEGKTVAVNTLNSAGMVTIRQSVRKAGGDPDALKFVELGFADMQPALTAGRVDAIFAVEPFLTAVLKDDGKVLAWNYMDVGEHTVAAAYFANDTYLASHPETLHKFRAGLKKSVDYANANPDEVRAMAATYTKIDPAVLENMTLPHFPSDINRESIKRQAELTLMDGIIKKPVAPETLAP